MQAITIDAYGDPKTVLTLTDLPEPPPPGLGEALIGVEFAPLNMHDLLAIRGHFFFLPTVPGPVGNEGVGSGLVVG